MFGFQGMEWVIILLIILIIFGPTKLPQLAKGLGQAMREFRKASAGAYDEEEEIKKVKEKGKEIDEETLKKLAEKLEVETEGKSKEELVEEVLAKAKEKGLI